MRHFIKALWVLIFLIPCFLFGQVLTNNAETAVSFRIVGYGEVTVDYSGCGGSGTTATYTYPGSSMSIDGNTVTATDFNAGDDSQTRPFSGTEVIDLQQNKEYTLTITQIANVYINCEAGYTSYVDGKASSLIVAPSSGTYTFSVLKNAVASSALPQFSEKVNFEFGVGGLSNGTGGGSIVLISDTIKADTFQPSGLAYTSVDTDDIEVVYASSVLRQILLPDSLVDIVDAGVSDGYEIRYYESGDFGTTKSGGVYPVNSGAQAFSKYRIKNPTSSSIPNDLEVTKYYNNNVVSLTEVLHNQSTNVWEYLSGDGTTVLSKRKVTVDTVNDYEIEEVFDGSNTLAYKSKTNYVDYAWGPEISSFVLDPDGKAFTQTYDYFDNVSNEGDYRKLKSIQYSTGAWVRYDYYDTDLDEGLIKRTYEPYLDSPSTPSANANNGRVTTYTYGSDVDAARTLPTKIETKINGVLVFKVENEFEEVSVLLNSKPVLKTTTKNYYGSGTNDFIQTESRAYSNILNVADWQYLAKVLSVKEPTGSQQSYLYQSGNYNTSSKSFSVSASGDYWRRVVFSGTSSTSVGDTVSYYGSDQDGKRIVPLNMVENESTIGITVFDPSGEVVRTTDRVYVGNSTYTLLESADFTYTNGGRVTTTERSNGLSTQTYYDAKGRIDYYLDTYGVRHDYIYDALGRIKKEIKKGVSSDGAYEAQVDITTELFYDGNGKVLRQEISAAGTSEKLIAENVFDLSGERVESISSTGQKTKFELEKVGSYYKKYTAQILNPDDTVYSEVTETKYLDGKKKEITGSGTIDQFFSYSIASNGEFTTTVRQESSSSPRLSSTSIDWLQREVKVSSPGSGSHSDLVLRSYYSNTTGLLIKQTYPGAADYFVEYDALGDVTLTGQDIDGSGGLSLSSSDRIEGYRSSFFKDSANDWWFVDVVETYPELNTSTAIQVQRVQSRISGFSGNDVSETRQWGIGPTQASLSAEPSLPYTWSIEKVYPTSKKSESHSGFSGISNASIVNFYNGLKVQDTSPSSVETFYKYDALARLKTLTGARGIEESYDYLDGTQLVEFVRDDNDVVLSENSYHPTLRSQITTKKLWSQETPEIYSTLRYDYNQRGQTEYMWGDGQKPRRYVFDTYGHVKQLHQFRGGSSWSGTDWPSLPGAADITEWEIEESTGLLLEKRDPQYGLDSSRKTTYTYDFAGRLEEATRPRAGTGTEVSITNTYDSDTGELTGVSYSDSTPNISYQYHRSGKVKQITDSSGTRVFEYRDLTSSTQDFQISSETVPYGVSGRLLSYSYDSDQRLSAVKFGKTNDTDYFQSTSYNYSSQSGRIDGINVSNRNGANSHNFNYQYVANSDLLDRMFLTIGSDDYEHKFAYETSRNYRSEISTKYGTSTYAKYVRKRDLIGRATKVEKSGSIFSDYGTQGALDDHHKYSLIGQLEESETLISGTTTSIPDRFFKTQFDSSGNRLDTRKYYDATNYQSDYTPNSLNQYSDRTVPQKKIVSASTGYNDAEITSTVKGTTVAGVFPEDGDYFYGELSYDTLVSDVIDDVSISDGEGSFAFKLSVTKSPHGFTYDKDGNLETDGRFEYIYDAESRPKEVRDTLSSSLVKWTFYYDYAGRKYRQDYGPYDATSGTFVGSPETKYFYYDGYSLIAEDNSSGTEPITFAWGLDLGGGIGSWGGVGGLLLVDQSRDSQWIPGYDGNGNVTTLTDAGSGALVKAFEYDAWGKLLRSSLESAVTDVYCPFLFSTKYYYSNLKLYDYGFRLYDPELGRFINRDPIEESGGVNLYEYAGNDPINATDYLGLYSQNVRCAAAVGGGGGGGGYSIGSSSSGGGGGGFGGGSWPTNYTTNANGVKVFNEIVANGGTTYGGPSFYSVGSSSASYGNSYGSGGGGGGYNRSDFFNTDGSVNPNVKDIPLGEYYSEMNQDVIVLVDGDPVDAVPKYANMFYPGYSVSVTWLGPKGRSASVSEDAYGNQTIELPEIISDFYTDGAIEAIDNHLAMIANSQAFIQAMVTRELLDGPQRDTSGMDQYREALRIQNFKQAVQQERLQADLKNFGIIATAITLPYDVVGVKVLVGAGLKRLTGKKLVDTSTIRFTQDTAGRNIDGISSFNDGRPIKGLIDDLSSGAVSPINVKPIRVFQKDGLTFTLDNRRLLAAHQAGVKVHVVPATPAEVAKEAFKLTTKTQGNFVGVKGALK